MTKSLTEGGQESAVVPSSSQQISLERCNGGSEVGEPRFDPVQGDEEEQSWGLDDYVLPGASVQPS